MIAFHCLFFIAIINSHDLFLCSHCCCSGNCFHCDNSHHSCHSVSGEEMQTSQQGGAFQLQSLSICKVSCTIIMLECADPMIRLCSLCDGALITMNSQWYMVCTAVVHFREVLGCKPVYQEFYRLY